MSDIKNREFTACTGKLGAIQFEIALRKQLYEYTDTPLTDEIIQEITDKVNNMDWKDGVYKIDKQGMRYLGKYE